MFLRHVTGSLSAYCEGVLSAAEASAVAQHVLACGRCREEMENVRMGLRLAATLQRPADVGWREVSWASVAPPAAVQRPDKPLRVSAGLIFAVAALVMLVAGALWAQGADGDGEGAYPMAGSSERAPALEIMGLSAMTTTDTARLRERHGRQSFALASALPAPRACLLCHTEATRL